jgi:hypothetical protein
LLQKSVETGCEARFGCGEAPPAKSTIKPDRIIRSLTELVPIERDSGVGAGGDGLKKMPRRG